MTEHEIALIQNTIITSTRSKFGPYTELDANNDIALCIELFDAPEPDIEKINKWFDEEISNRNSNNIELLLFFLWHYGINKQFAETLAPLLLEDWHTCHIDIAIYLEKAKVPSTAKYLYSAATMNFNYLDHESCFDLICMDALANINNDESIEYLYALCKRKNIVISTSEKQFFERHKTGI